MRSARQRKKQRSGWRKFFDAVLALAILASIGLIVLRLEKVSSQQFQGTPIVIDGDTVRYGEERLRLRGIDAPEIKQVCRRAGHDFECGRAARDALAAYAYSGLFSCEGWERDKYRRLLVICYKGKQDVNAALVETGWAVSYGGYAAAERKARESRAGLWAGEFDRPRDWRVMHGSLIDDDHRLSSRFFNWIAQLLFDGDAPALHK